MVSKNDIGYRLEDLFDIVGEEKFLEITQKYGGDNIYIPKYKSVLRNHRNREIIEKYNGTNAIQLAKEYDVCVTHVNRIVSSK